MIPPWLQSQWGEICDRLGQLPVGLMLVGVPGLGKLELAFGIARALLCEQPIDGQACGSCRNCVAIDKGLHPDLHFVTNEQFALEQPEARGQLASRYLEPGETGASSRKPRKIIAVNQIRVLIDRLGTHSHGGGARIALIAPASSLNVNAANALLKILEEPPGNTRFLLVCANRDSVPATILSRVSVVECHAPGFAESRDWLLGQGVPARYCRELLALSSSAPLTALSLFEQGIAEQAEGWRTSLLQLLDGRLLPVAMAAEVGRTNVSHFLYWFECLLGDAISVGHGRRGDTLMITDTGADRELVKRLNSSSLWDMIDKLRIYRCRQQRAIDEQLFLEDVLIAVWQKDRSLRKAVKS